FENCSDGERRFPIRLGRVKLPEHLALERRRNMFTSRSGLFYCSMCAVIVTVVFYGAARSQNCQTSTCAVYVCFSFDGTNTNCRSESPYNAHRTNWTGNPSLWQKFRVEVANGCTFAN